MEKELFAVIRRPNYKLKELEIWDKTDASEVALHLIKDREFLSAIFIASRDLYQAILNFKNGKNTEKEKIRSISESVYSYFLRMCIRPTPFGKFSGICVVNLTRNGQSTLDSEDKLILHAFLDNSDSRKIYNTLLRNRKVVEQLELKINNSIYIVENTARFVQYTYIGGKRKYELVSYDIDEVLLMVLNDCKNTISFSKLLTAFEKLGFDIDDSKDFIQELLDSQILWTTLEPTITGKNYGDILIETLKQIGDKKSLNELFETINIANGINQNLISLSQAPVLLNNQKLLRYKYDLSIKNNSSKSAVSIKIINSIKSANRLLLKLPPCEDYNRKIDTFKSIFVQRFGEAVLPLSQALDSEIGIDYNNLPLQHNKEKITSFKFIEKIKRSLYAESAKNRSKVIRISSTFLKKIPESHLQLANSHSFFGSIIKSKEQENLVYKNISGPSALLLLGRFGSVNEDLKTKLVDLCKSEENLEPNKIFAEIAHIPQDRAGNIIERPNYRDYEIPVLTNSQLPVNNQILLSDLLVGVRLNRVFLWSKRLNKEVVPRLSCAHNYFTNNLAIYHFLCDMQNQNTAPILFWSWDQLEKEQFLPRVVFEDVIMSPATWNISLKGLHSKHKTHLNKEMLVKLLDNNKVPSKFLLIEESMEHLFDLSNDSSISILLKKIRKLDHIVIHEFLFDRENNLDGYCNEIIVPFVEPINIDEPILSQTFIPLEESPIQYKELANSNWLYYRLFMNESYINTFLVESLSKFISSLPLELSTTSFFYIRYNDPYDHLRIRFKFSSIDVKYEFQKLFDQFISKYLAAHKIWDLQQCLYSRETQRYGLRTIYETETFFSVESRLCMEVLCSSTNIHQLILFAVKYISDTFNEFNFSTSDIVSFSRQNLNSFYQEFSMNKKKKKDIDLHFRRIEKYLFQTINNEKYLDSEFMLNKSIIKIYDNYISLKQSQIIRIQSLDDRFSKEWHYLQSLIHMFVNRVFEGNPREQEMLLYSFINKMYRKRQGNNS